MNPIIDELEKSYLKENTPDANPGDTVKVFVRIVEGNKERIRLLRVLLLKNTVLVLIKLLQLEKYFKALA